MRLSVYFVTHLKRIRSFGTSCVFGSNLYFYQFTFPERFVPFVFQLSIRTTIDAGILSNVIFGYVGSTKPACNQVAAIVRRLSVRPSGVPLGAPRSRLIGLPAQLSRCWTRSTFAALVAAEAVAAPAAAIAADTPAKTVELLRSDAVSTCVVFVRSDSGLSASGRLSGSTFGFTGCCFLGTAFGVDVLLINRGFIVFLGFDSAGLDGSQLPVAPPPPKAPVDFGLPQEPEAPPPLKLPPPPLPKFRP
jgi:hypothetical protein